MSESGPLSGHRLSRPTRAALTVGRGALAAAVSRLTPGFTLVSQPAALAALPDDVLSASGSLVHARSLDRQELQRLLDEVPDTVPVLGFGGGVVMDSAKWLAGTLGVPLVLAPGVVSVDACVTNTVAVRDKGRIGYEGFVVADAVVVDTDLVRAAPPGLNRAGVGDLLSVHTALWDWREAASVGLARGAAYDPSVARAASGVLASVAARGADIAAVSDVGITTLVEGFADINDLTVSCGHPQMEEGSEHYLAYCLETQTGRSFVHGQVVTLGVVLLSRLQGNDPQFARTVADTTGVAWHPADLDLDRDTLRRALRALPDFVEDAAFPGSVVDLRADELRADQGLVDTLLEGLEVR
ncbi:MAG TPA: iron-containing alcohol dehydrogenase [Actinomycetes bacterium]|nr:iron-containing alcohol dehydrogenase [Actinomycetes bacterium]